MEKTHQMAKNETILVLDFGSQYSQLIARRIRECKVYSRIVPFSTSVEEIRAEAPAGIILSGGPASVYQEHAPKCDPEIFNLGIPVLGICYGLQLTVMTLGGNVARGNAREYGKAEIEITGESPLLKGLPSPLQVWMSHGDKVTALPDGFIATAKTGNTEFAAIRHTEKQIYGIQFHPEVVHTHRGTELIRNFAMEICGCTGSWNRSSNAVSAKSAKPQRDRRSFSASAAEWTPPWQPP